MTTSASNHTTTETEDRLAILELGGSVGARRLAREPVSVEIEGVQIAALARRAEKAGRPPLLAALHGGGYTGRYFDLDGASLLDVGVGLGYSVATIDRPGYGASGPAVLGEDTFKRQAELLGLAIAHIAAFLGADEVILVGHSIGGMIVLEIAAAPPRGAQPKGRSHRRNGCGDARRRWRRGARDDRLGGRNRHDRVPARPARRCDVRA